MAVPKKPSNPGLGSWTNPMPAAARSSKSRPPAAPGTASPAKDSASLTPPDSKSTGKGKKAGRQRRRNGGSSSGFADRLVLFLLALFVAYSVTVCPSDTELDNPVCHSLSLYRQHVLDPFVLPPIYQALEHPAVSPYVQKAIDAQERVRPYYVTADVRLRPYARKAKQVAWDGIVVPTYNKHVAPAYSKHLVPLYQQHVQPRLQLLLAKVDPYISPFYENIITPLNQAKGYAEHGYETTLPYLQNSYETIHPYVVKAYDRAKPFALAAYGNVRVYSIKAYVVSRPYVKLAYSNLLIRLKLGLKTLGKWRKLYVDRQVLKIWEKVVELSGNEVKTPITSSTTTSAAEVEETFSPVAEPTSADEEVKTIDLPVTTDEPVTAKPVEEEEAAPVIPEELIPPTTSSSIPEETLSNTNVDVPEALETASASVVGVYDSYTSSLSEAAASIASSVSSSVTEAQESQSATLDIPGPSVSITSEAVLDPVEEPSEEDDGLDDLLASLGLDDAVVEASLADASESTSADEETAARETLSAEEKAARKKEKTAKDRANLEQKHQEWFEKLDDLVETQTRRVRELLQGLRTAAAGALWDRAPIPSSIEVANFDTITSQDYDTLIYVNGDRVSQAMDKLSAEGEQLIKGLESYLKRESKPTKNVASLGERQSKWSTVLGKVEDKFESATMEMQNKVRQWFINVRDIEIRECLAISASVKALAERAQADLGLGYVWLDDVTYYDWQKYHDLMRKYERFDEYVRLVQNGTHTEPPPDPVIDGLDKLQLEQEDLVSGFFQRTRALNLKALDEVFVAEEPPKDEEPQASILPIGASDIAEQVDAPAAPPQVDGATETPELGGSSIVIDKDLAVAEDMLKDIPAEDPVMSILPIETTTATEGSFDEFDASQVVIGKDKVAMEEALKGVPVEEVRVHGEL